MSKYLQFSHKKYFYEQENLKTFTKYNEKFLDFFPIEKKNYYLPLPKIYYLPAPSLILQNIPGTWTPQKSFYISENASIDINKIINFVCICIVYYVMFIVYYLIFILYY